ncbi:MAG: ABC transporter permease [Rhizobiales bacterium]|nr:ABC transporter permease [Hyphomicrobiales bacterium]OJU31079.1 MAG: ABC transporter permease [Rhizobiales bacterium 68-8]
MRKSFSASNAGRTANVVAVLLAIAVIWEILVRLFNVPSFLLPRPTAVVASLYDDPAYYLRHAWATLSETLLGYCSAIVVGVLLSIAVLYSRIIEQTVYTFLVTLSSIPKVALAPLFIIWLGTGTLPIIGIVFFIALFPVVMNSVQGLKSVEPDMIDLARSMRSSGGQMLWKIRIPNALPSMFTGFKVGISMAFIGAVVGEFVTSVKGLGYVIISAQSNFDTAQMFAAVVMLAVVGTALFFTIDFLERTIIPWHVSHRGATAGAH